MKQERCNNQSKIFCEISTSKFEGQYAAQEDLCIQLKLKSPVGVFQGTLQNFETAAFETNFWGLLLKRK